ncbi:hypothetical protein P3T16_000092 [Paraburkholderia sp. GAS42]
MGLVVPRLWFCFLLAFPCIHVGLLASPLCGAAPTFLCPCQRKVGKRKAPKCQFFRVCRFRGMAPHEVSPPPLTQHGSAHETVPRTAHFVTKDSSTRLRVASPSGITFTSRHVTPPTALLPRGRLRTGRPDRFRRRPLAPSSSRRDARVRRSELTQPCRGLANPSATHAVRSGVDERLVTGGTVRETFSCADLYRFCAGVTLHGVPFPGSDTPRNGRVFGAFLLPTFLWQGQRKVGAAPHRGNANRPT